jgi:hypothetical protein
LIELLTEKIKSGIMPIVASCSMDDPRKALFCIEARNQVRKVVSKFKIHVYN